MSMGIVPDSGGVVNGLLMPQWRFANRISEVMSYRSMLKSPPFRTNLIDPAYTQAYNEARKGAPSCLNDFGAVLGVMSDACKKASQECTGALVGFGDQEEDRKRVADLAKAVSSAQGFWCSLPPSLQQRMNQNGVRTDTDTLVKPYALDRAMGQAGIEIHTYVKKHSRRGYGPWGAPRSRPI